MNSLIILLIKIYTYAVLFHPSYQLAVFRASVLIKPLIQLLIGKPIPYYFSKLSIPSLFTIFDLICKYSSSCYSDPFNLTAFNILNCTISPNILDITNISINYYILQFLSSILSLHQYSTNPYLIVYNYQLSLHFTIFISSKFCTALFIYK